LPGAGESLAQGGVRQLEESSAAQFPEALAVIGAERMNAERRAARLRVRDLEYEFDGEGFEITIRLSAGSFATTVLRELISNDTGE
jgi:tRNA pseudouridine13 synthase